MDDNKKKLRELKRRKRKDNDQDSIPVIILRVLWFLIDLAMSLVNMIGRMML